MKIKKIINVALHKDETLKTVVEKLKSQRSSYLPNAFWQREQYFVDIPYKQGFKDAPQKIATHQMSLQSSRTIRKKTESFRTER